MQCRHLSNGQRPESVSFLQASSAIEYDLARFVSIVRLTNHEQWPQTSPMFHVEHQTVKN